MDFEHIVNEYGDALLRVCFIYLKDREMAEDALQETFFRAYRHRDEFRGRSSVKTWITRIAINTCKDMLSDSWMRHRTDEELTDIPAEEPEYSPEDRYAVTSKISALPEIYRDVIILRYYQELKIKEIAVILGETEANIKTRLKRARNILRTELKEVFEDE